MKRSLLIFLLLYALPLPAEEVESPGLTEEQAGKFQAAEEKHKDNPYMMRLIQQIKEGVIEKNKDQQTTTPAPAEPKFDASKETADSAYSGADYETAFQHYKVLAEEGDPEAAMMLGVLYQSGKGTEQDNAAAHAWYRKAREGGMTSSRALLEQMEDTDITPEERKRAEEYYKEISEESGDGEEPDSGYGRQDSMKTQTGKVPVVTMSYGTNLESATAEYQYDTPSREVRITPEKVNPMPHPAPTVSQLEHTQPERFFR